MSWDTQLETASFRGVEFACQVIDDDLGRRLAEHSYPYRSGSDFEDLGRKARSTRLRVVFLGEDYLGDLGAFLQAADAGRTGLFQHPLMGSWQAKCRTYPVHHEHGARDMATLEVEFVEDGTNTALPDLFSVSQGQADVEEAAVASLAANQSLLDKAIAGVEDAVASARAFAAEATAAVQNAVDRVNQIRAKVNSLIQAMRDLTDIQRWPLTRALRRLVHSAAKLAKAVESLAPPLVFHTVGASSSVSMIAHALYGDASRAQQLLSLNRIANPYLVPAGTRLRVYGR